MARKCFYTSGNCGSRREEKLDLFGKLNREKRYGCISKVLILGAAADAAAAAVETKQEFQIRLGGLCGEGVHNSSFSLLKLNQ